MTVPTAPGGAGSLPTDNSPSLSTFPDYWQVAGDTNPDQMREAGEQLKTASTHMADCNSAMLATMASLQADWKGWASEQFQHGARKLTSVASTARDALADLGSITVDFAGYCETAITRYKKLSGEYDTAADNANAAATRLNRVNREINAGGGNATPEQAREQQQATKNLSDAESDADGYAGTATQLISDYNDKATQVRAAYQGRDIPGGPSFGAPVNVTERSKSALGDWFRQWEETFKVAGKLGSASSSSRIPGYIQWVTNRNDNLGSGGISTSTVITVVLTLFDGAGLVEDLSQAVVREVGEEIGVIGAEDELTHETVEAIEKKLDELLADPATADQTLKTLFTAEAKGTAKWALDYEEDQVESALVDKLNDYANQNGITIPQDIEDDLDQLLGPGLGAAAYDKLTDYEKSTGGKVGSIIGEILAEGPE